jgi:purine nucleosidase
MVMKVILDTDPGIDDALAILLLAASPEVSLEAITVTHGNTNIDKCTRNSLQLIELAGIAAVPVARGASEPMVKSLSVAEETHGNGGLGYARLPEPTILLSHDNAVDTIISLIHRYPNEITLLCIGPMTNIALAILKDPSIVALVKRVISMGGAFHFPGNATPDAEYNVFCDPESYDIILRAGFDLTIVPLDVTYKCIFTKEHLSRLSEAKPEIREFITDSTRFYMEFHDEYQSIDGCAINDPLAAAILIDPDLVRFRDYYVTVELKGEHTKAKTSADHYGILNRAANAKVAMEVNVPGFMDFFISRMKML